MIPNIKPPSKIPHGIINTPLPRETLAFKRISSYPAARTPTVARAHVDWIGGVAEMIGPGVWTGGVLEETETLCGQTVAGRFERDGWVVEGETEERC